MAITAFRGEHRFLSNFYPSLVLLDDKTYTSVEHAYQASKTLDEKDRRKIRETNGPASAKRIGQKVALRPNWQTLRFEVMLDLLRQKFARRPMGALLLATGTEMLIEINEWNDSFWGVCRGKGANHLGRLLMQVRAELQQEAKP